MNLIMRKARPEDQAALDSVMQVISKEPVQDRTRAAELIENVAVLPEYQGKGVGKAMFQEIERWGKEQDCHYEMLVSGLQRTGAHKFYNALGFDEVKGFKKYL